MSLKFNTYVRSVSVINNNAEKLIFNAILWSFGFLAILYIIFLGNMVKNIIERQSLATKANVLSGEVRDLELNYLSMSNGVDLTLAKSLGFKEIKTTFANHKSLGYNMDNLPISNKKIVNNDL